MRSLIPWLKEHYDNADIIAVCADVGQGKETEGLEEKALKTGASKLYIEDITDEFITDAIFPCVKANAVYEGKYLLGTSMASPVIAKRLVEIAKKEGITITTDEYEELLPEYAEKFGYEDDTERFAQECDKDTIAAEMLYDKACSYLEKKAG